MFHVKHRAWSVGRPERATGWVNGSIAIADGTPRHRATELAVSVGTTRAPHGGVRRHTHRDCATRGNRPTITAPDPRRDATATLEQRNTLEAGGGLEDLVNRGEP